MNRGREAPSIRTNSERGWFVAALAATVVGAVSFPVLAQREVTPSQAEEGSDAVVQPAPPPPPAAPLRATGPITVSGAYYGTPSKNCDATRFVAHRANGKSTYSFDVSNEMCGDPARGDRKELNVTYVCGSIAKTAQAYEHRTIYLDCNP